MDQTELRYGFGANWQSFVDTALDTRRIIQAAHSLRQMLGAEHLRGRSFLDIGCGSGLFSLAACLLGADRVVAFDYDANSVGTSMALRARAAIPESRWQIAQGSVLDPAFVERLGTADIVYSWGVLHHTGAMWRAIDNAAGCVRPGGLFALAIYNQIDRAAGGSRMWWHVKRAYNLAPPPLRRAMEAAYISALAAQSLANLRDPLAMIRDYSSQSRRGMDFWHDVRDWLGGFPYEYATVDALFAHLHGRHGMQLEYLRTSSGAGCNELTFRRPGAAGGGHAAS